MKRRSLPIALLVCVLWWTAICSDWSIQGAWSDAIALLLVTGLSIRALLRAPSKPALFAWLLVALPGIFMLLMALPMLLGTMFWLDQKVSEHTIEVQPQPDGPWTARVLLQDDGFIGGGNRLELTVRHAWLPFVERSLSTGEAALDPDSGLGRPYATWLHDGRVNLNGVRNGSGKFEPAGVRWHVPLFIAIPAALVGVDLDL